MSEIPEMKDVAINPFAIATVTAAVAPQPIAWCFHEWEALPPMFVTVTGPAPTVIEGVTPTHRCRKCGLPGVLQSVIYPVGIYGR
jgi:hypothetical protein